MSRQIPEGPLSDEDRAYLLLRSRHGEVERMDFEYPAEVVDGPDRSKALEDMNREELMAEIDRRNEGQPADNHLSKAGNKAEVVARIRAHDESVLAPAE